MQTDFEAMGGTYTRGGDYLLPNVEVPENPKICIWGERRRKYLRECQKPLTDEEKIEIASKRIMKQYKPAYEEPAKT